MVCTAMFWNHQNDKKFGPVFVKLQALYTERCIWDYTHTCATRAFISHRPIDKLIYQIYQLVGGFPAKLLSSCISQNIFFHMIGDKSFHFIFWNWGVSNTGLYLKGNVWTSKREGNHLNVYRWIHQDDWKYYQKYIP